MSQFQLKFKFKGIRFYNEQFHRTNYADGKKRSVTTQLKLGEHSLISNTERELKFHFKFSIPLSYTISFDGDVILESPDQGQIDTLIEHNPSGLDCIAYENILFPSLNNVRKIALQNKVMPPAPHPPVVIQKVGQGRNPQARQGQRPIDALTQPSQNTRHREISYQGNWAQLKAIPDNRITTEIFIPLKPNFPVKEGNYQIGSELVNLTFERDQTVFRIQRKIIEEDVDYSKLAQNMPLPDQVIPTYIIEYWNTVLKQNGKSKQFKIRNIDLLTITIKYKLKGKEIAGAIYPSVK